MPDPGQLIDQHGLAIASLMLVSGALVIVAKVLYGELVDRRQRAEQLVDTLIAAFDKATDVTQAALDELRKP